MLEQLKYTMRGCDLIIDDIVRGRLDLEFFADDHMCIHYRVDEEFRRLGFVSRMVDGLYRRKLARYIHWTDEPFYKVEHRRNGIMTPAGKAFADAYRLKNGIAIPNMTFNERYEYVPRMEKT